MPTSNTQSQTTANHSPRLPRSTVDISPLAPPKDPYKRSPVGNPVMIRFLEDWQPLAFAPPTEDAWSPGGHGRRFGVLLDRAIKRAGISERDVLRYLFAQQARTGGTTDRWGKITKQTKNASRHRAEQAIAVKDIIQGKRPPLHMYKERWMWPALARLFVDLPLLDENDKPVPGPLIDEHVRYIADVERFFVNLEKDFDLRQDLSKFIMPILFGLAGTSDPAHSRLDRTAISQACPGLWDVIANGEARIRSLEEANEWEPDPKDRVPYGTDWPMSTAPHSDSRQQFHRDLVDGAEGLDWSAVLNWFILAAPPDIADLLIFLGCTLLRTSTLEGPALRIDLAPHWKQARDAGLSAWYQLYPPPPEHSEKSA